VAEGVGDGGGFGGPGPDHGDRRLVFAVEGVAVVPEDEQRAASGPCHLDCAQGSWLAVRRDARYGPRARERPGEQGEGVRGGAANAELAVLAGWLAHPSGPSPEEQFRLGLGFLLDGIARRLDDGGMD
jgi:hypothetical protein